MWADIGTNIVEALRIGTGFLWTAGWAIILGLMITSWVQSFVSKRRIAGLLGKPDLVALARATGFGAASSGCSFGAAAIGKGIFKKGAHPINVLAFMFASTNLIVELGLMILILFGWEFLAAELIGGLVLIVVMSVLARMTIPESIFEEARAALKEADAADGKDTDPVCGTVGTDEHTIETDGRTLRFCSAECKEAFEQEEARSGSWYETLWSWGSLYQLGNRYRKEWSMIWKDVVAGFLISGFVIVFVPQAVWNTLFLEGDGMLATLENAFMGVAVAVISFVGSIGNVPFAVALWSGGVGFAGVIAFIYSDLITIPVLNVYRKYYGWRATAYIFAIFFVTMAISGFLMELTFSALDIVPKVVAEQSAQRQAYFTVDYTLWLNLLAISLSGFLLWVVWYKPRGPYRDPVCGMSLPEGARSVTIEGESHRFCSKRCERVFRDQRERSQRE